MKSLIAFALILILAGCQPAVVIRHTWPDGSTTEAELDKDHPNGVMFEYVKPDGTKIRYHSAASLGSSRTLDAFKLGFEAAKEAAKTLSPIPGG